MMKSAVALSEKQILSDCVMFLTPMEVLRLADSICHELSAAMASHETELWASLVAQMFPDALFATVNASSTNATTEKDLFRLLVHASTPFSMQHDTEVSRWKSLSRGAQIVPMLAFGAALERLCVQFKSMIFHLSLGNAGTASYDGVLLRENVQDVKLVSMHHCQQTRPTKSKLSALKRTFSKRIATKKRENKSLPPIVPANAHTGVLVITKSHVILQSAIFEAGVWATPLDNLENVEVTQNSPQLFVRANQQAIVVTTNSLEGPNRWVAALQLLKQRHEACKVQSSETVSSSAEPVSSNQHLLRDSSSKKPRCSSTLARAGSFSLSMPRAISTFLPLVGMCKPKLRQIELSSSGVSTEKIGLPASAKTKGLLAKVMSFSFNSRHRTTRVFLMPPQVQRRRASVSFCTAWIKSKHEGGLKRSSGSSTISSEQSVAIREEDDVCLYKEDSASRSMSAFAPRIEGSEVEPRVVDPVHLTVYRLLDNTSSFEGQVCRRFLSRTMQFQDLSSPVICRAYLIKVRGCMQDLVRFMLTFRLTELQGTNHRITDDTSSLVSDDRCENSASDDDDHRQCSPALAAKVQFAVESYFCSDRLRRKLEKWCCVVANGPQKAFEHKFVHWGATLCASSLEFGLKNPNGVERSCSMKLAIQNFHAIGVESTPSRKVACLLEAVQALHNFIAHTDCQGSSKGGGNADELLPLFIFAVCRSQLATPLAQCAAMRTLYPFVSQHGERGYYVTMLETALEFVRQYPSNCYT